MNIIQVIKQNKKNLFLWAIVGLMVLSFAVKAWHFNDWLYFNLDQARDAELAREAFEEGPGHLPLLGPRAAGTFLRLGPAYYYFQYLSAETFGTVEPYVFAYPDLLFSILAIPLFYFFAKEFLRRKTALAVTALFSFSFVLVQYSRFSWNTNSLPFWTLLFIFSLYLAYKKQKEGKPKIGGRWLVGAAASYGIASQLHFLAFVGLPVAGVLFLLFHFPKKINLKYWLWSVLAIAVLYIPMIASDIKTGGNNVAQFLYAVFAKTGEEGASFLENLIETAKHLMATFSMFLTSFGDEESRLALLLGGVVLFAGVSILLRKWSRKEIRPLIFLLLIWMLIFFVLLLKSDTSLKPRFFLPLAPIPFIFLGLIFERIQKFLGFKGVILSAIVLAVFLAANFNGIFSWYGFLATQNDRAIKRELFLKQSDGVTLEKMKEAVDYMASKADSRSKDICYDARNEHAHTYEYLIYIHYPGMKEQSIKHYMPGKEKCVFFAIAPNRDEARQISTKYKNDFKFIKKNEFGRIAIWDLEPTEEYMDLGKTKPVKDIENTGDDEEIPDVDNVENISDIRNVPDDDNDESDGDTEEDEEEEIIEEPEKEERLLWKDVVGW